MAKISQYTDGGTVQDTDLFISARAGQNYKNLWSTFKSTLKTYFDTLYQPIGGTSGIPVDGWVAGTGTWSYSSADSPTFVISINADVTALIGVGDRIKLTQTTAKYFIVTAVGSFSGGATLVTVYGGTDYTLANAAITSPYYSHVKAPFGFPLTPAKWTVTTTDSSVQTQAGPTNLQWYNMGSVQIVAPIGVWNGSLFVVLQSDAAGKDIQTTLSTANNSESNSERTVNAYSGAGVAVLSAFRSFLVTAASKTTLYANARTTTSAANITWGNTTIPMVISLVCAYL